MSTSIFDDEHHNVHRTGWLRAAVLGANDGIVSTASLLIGMTAASAGKPALLLTGVAALVAGAMSMAAGEYISVSSQRDREAADLKKEAIALREAREAEKIELAQIYEERGVWPQTWHCKSPRSSWKKMLSARMLEMSLAYRAPYTPTQFKPPGLPRLVFRLEQRSRFSWFYFHSRNGFKYLSP